MTQDDNIDLLMLLYQYKEGFLCLIIFIRHDKIKVKISNTFSK